MRSRNFAEEAFEMVRKLPMGAGPDGDRKRVRAREEFEALVRQAMAHRAVDFRTGDVLQRMFVTLQSDTDRLCSEMDRQVQNITSEIMKDGFFRAGSIEGVATAALRVEGLRVRCETIREMMKMVFDRLAVE